MLTIILLLATFILALLGIIHLYWAFGGSWGGRVAVPSTTAGSPTFRPGRLATIVVAAALFAAAELLAMQADLLPQRFDETWTIWGCRMCAIVFGVRTIGDFRYVGLFRSVRGTAFAKYDARLFTPLCFLLCLAYIAALIAS
ncbi:conserved hypothetical protein [Paenibacillus curdlanolyticus YK9]|uniref:DUF3995 domain-containing protein n=1 Tax=Paenibacillus curdlanolyticus YK9 TaxID=717606 RepID=E0I7Y8_9BACL|nr:DUF3995 domain-containing protein [Paenibacillus curdlanolyticus]EFM11293.1 conserved hypothetical protein [Paenibacillus curdlanolyticus YK9]